MRSNSFIALFLAFAMLAIASKRAAAQCVNTANPTCEIYTTCFAKYCPCQGDPSEYFQTYGKKYCQRFLSIQNFSASGKNWRNSTLKCLQETIVPDLDISDNPKCDCGRMKGVAYKSHVACYTKPGASICDLSATDINEIRKVIDTADLFTSEGWKQMGEVAKICVKTAPDDGRRTAWKAIDTVLRLR